jgi:iron complex outermembrane recepter protein
MKVSCQLAVSSRMLSGLLGTSVIALLAMIPTTRLVAQTAPTPAEDAGVQEIVVTANRRSENLQTVGIAVTAFTGDAIASKGIVETSDLGSITPGLIISEAGGSELAGLVSIRGVSQNDFTGQIESPNAFYIDDFYQPSASSSVQQLFDINRVEVLKGPQGTLFGRNATGGLLNVFTNDPTEELSGYFQSSFGNFNAFNIRAAVSGGLSDNVRGRIAVLRNTHGPYYKNITATGPDLNPDNTFAVRGKLHIDGNENFTAKLGFDYYLADYKNSGGSGEVPAGLDPVTGLGFNLPINTPFALAPRFVQTGGPFETSASVAGGYFREAYGVSANLNYDFGGFQLASLSNFSKVKTDYKEDNDQTPFDVGTFEQASNSRHFTQEFRLYGEQDSFRWNTGVYFLYIDGTYSNRFNFIAADADLLTVYTIKSKSYSAFAQIAYDLGDKVTVTAGGRIVRDERDYLYNWSCGGSPTAGCGAFGGPGTIGGAARFRPLTNKNGETGWTGRLQLDFKATDDLLLYASINRGYKGFNYNANFAGNIPLKDLILKGEKLLAFEAGAKLTFWDGKARFNTAGYIYDYKDFHAYDQRGLNFTLFNSDSKISGLEGELTLRPTTGLTISSGFNFLFRADVFNVPIAAQRLTRRAAQSPKFTANAAIQQVFDTSIGEFTAQADVSHTASSYSYLSNAPNTLLPSAQVVNVRLTFAPQSLPNTQISIYSTNLLNNKKPTYAFDLAVAGYTELNYGDPRLFGIEAKITF